MVDVSMNAPRPIERVWIIAIGSEMLTPFRNDTNSIYITEKLNDLGIEVRGKTIVGDNHVTSIQFATGDGHAQGLGIIGILAVGTGLTGRIGLIYT